MHISIDADTQHLSDCYDSIIHGNFDFMPSPKSEPITREMRRIMKCRRLQIIDKVTNKPISLRQFGSDNDLDPSLISRFENPPPSYDECKDRIPSITFWIDYSLALGDDGDLGEIQREAMKNLNLG